MMRDYCLIVVLVKTDFGRGIILHHCLHLLMIVASKYFCFRFTGFFGRSKVKDYVWFQKVLSKEKKIVTKNYFHV